MDEINLRNALQKIVSATSVTDRDNGLSQFRHILSYNRNSQKMRSLDEKVYKEIFSTLSEVTSDQVDIYAGLIQKGRGKGLTKSSISNNRPRLSSCAAAMRLSVEAGGHVIRAKTARFVLEHILQAFSSGPDGRCEPLESDYFKCIRMLLEYQPHTEHLSAKEWGNLAEFCLDRITRFNSDSQSSNSLQDTVRSSSKTPEPSTHATPRSGTQGTGAGKRILSSTTGVDDLLASLRQLTLATNAPVFSYAPSILSCLVGFLQIPRTLGPSHVDAFAIVNTILSKYSLDSIQVVQTALNRVLPVIKSSWTTRLQSLKDEMLVTLIYSRAHLEDMLQTKSEEPTDLRHNLESILEFMLADYTKRAEKDQLQIDDLQLRCSTDHAPNSHPLKLALFSLKPGNLRSEHNWVTVYFMGRISALLDATRKTLDRSFLLEDEMPNKKQRTSENLHDYIRQLSSTHQATKVCALQLIAFMTQELRIDKDDLAMVVERVTNYISDGNPAVSSWAMLAIGSCALQISNITDDLKSSLATAWRLASRNLPTAASCRAASHVMDIVLRLGLLAYTEVAEAIEALVSSAELNGPAVIADTTSSLWVTILHLKTSESPHTFQSSFDRMLRWFISKWTPSNFGERQHTSQNSQHTHPCDITRLLCPVVGHEPPLYEDAAVMSLGPIALAWHDANRDPRLVEYLLLLDQNQALKPQLGLPMTFQISNPSVQRPGSSPAASLILDYCITEVEKSRHRWVELTAEKTKGLNSEMFRVLTTLCVVSSELSNDNGMEPNNKLKELQRVTTGLVKAIAKVISRGESEQHNVDAVLEVVLPSLPMIRMSNSFDSSFFDAFSINPLVLHLSKALEKRRTYKDTQGAKDDRHDFDLEDEFDSQISNGSASHEDIEFPHRGLTGDRSIESMRISTMATMSLLSFAAEDVTLDKAGSHIPSNFIDYLVSLSSSEFLAAKRLIIDLVASPLHLSIQDAENLLEYAAERFVAVYKYERSEVGVDLIVQLMTGTVPYWSDPNSSLHDMGADIYEWLVKTLNAGATSAGVQKALAKLFHALMETRMEYAQELSLPSVRTSLFGLLKESSISVRYFVVERLSSVFNLFVLDKHEAIYDDVLASLPSDEDWQEAIALRLLALCRLGSSWHTLLRLSVYHIFETAGLVKQAAKHAQKGMDMISTSLRLEDSKALFRLFAPQLLFTWLDAQPLENMPFSVFGYKSLTHLLKDVEEEAYSQMIMRGKDQAISNLLKHLEVSHEEILRRSLSRATAYCIAWDTSNSRAVDKSSPGSEQRLRQVLGEDQYISLIKQLLPRVIGVTLLSMEQPDTLEKAISKKPDFGPAGRALSEIQNISSSETILPAGQQPSFRASLVLDQLERLCRRVGTNTGAIWTPDCFVCVARFLLDAIHPELGSLHAALVIRKYRVLVSLAGPLALEGYPLQMSLHALRPFLTDRHCAGDAIGILQFLLQHGRTYLLDDLPFVAGLSISILLSFREFLASSQDSTTQESQYISTMQRARRFHSWLSSYLTDYILELSHTNSSRTTEAALSLFQVMVAAASDMGPAGSAVEGTPESRLLWSLLEDEGRERKLLNGPSRNKIYGLLTRPFQSPPSFRQDVFRRAKDASQYATSVWKSTQQSEQSPEYLLWAARVLGRMYCATGEVPETLRQAVRGKQEITRGGRRSSSKTSWASIAEILLDLLFVDRPKVISLAEEALRLILSTKDRTEELFEVGHVIPHSIATALGLSGGYDLPSQLPSAEAGILESAYSPENKEVLQWASDLCISLVVSAPQDVVIGALPRLLSRVNSLGKEMFPYVLHLALSQNFDHPQNVKIPLSEGFRSWFERCDDGVIPYLKIILESILYLRKQQIPRETTIADRVEWLDVDHLQVSRAAVRCGMHRAALLFMEAHANQPVRSSRRSSALVQQSMPIDLQLSIYKNLDEPDSFYGVEQDASITSVLERFEYEENGFKSLMFHGARQDSRIRRQNDLSPSEPSGTIRSLTMLNLNSITHSLLSNADFRDPGNQMIDSALGAARRLEQWDVRAFDSSVSEPAVTYAALQGISNSTDADSARKCLDRGFLQVIKNSSITFASAQTAQSSLRALAVLTEIDEVMSCRTTAELYETLDMMRNRGKWMEDGHLADVRSILSSRETLFSLLCDRPRLHDILHTSAKDLRSYQISSLIEVSTACRKHGASQESLASATYLSDIIPDCRKVGLDVEAAVQFEVASVLWDQGEMTSSIRMLQQLEANTKSGRNSSGTSAVARSVLLMKLGKQIDEARLEKPDEIMKNYLEPAIEDLKSNRTGPEAGQVFHEFAAFCDRQLQSQEVLDDMGRIKTLADRKEEEIREYERMAKTAKSKKEKASIEGNAKRSRRWYDMDMLEYKRLADSRQAFLRQSLENYMLCLQACDNHDHDVLRMFALWFEYADLPMANEAVSNQIESVPSGKFTILMNQLSSRLQSEPSLFQQLLSKLVCRICIDHPYHGMNHMFSGSMNENNNDAAARSRTAATVEVINQIKKSDRGMRYWRSVQGANKCYHEMAFLKDGSFKSGKNYDLENFAASKKMMTTVPQLKVPPITLHVAVRPDLRYTDVPRIVSFHHKMGIAGGNSMPKIVTAMATDGKPHKQLLKAGNDDMRQDAIMEQVFEHVSQLLRNHSTTRVRNLQIRTYKVLPLSARSGVMEFVQNTKALMDYLIPAHDAYHPKDWKMSRCRSEISNASQLATAERVKVYRQVAEHFSPVLRYFFLERFQDPDEWFEKRLAYTRSTAAISILGHVLGLGDRHCHNILLDEKSGEVVHIDLGIAFEAGRVLPVPEVVPFRASRDIVDAMGYTKTEGVFRRCCEFTMDTLRDERDSIMTILNVLRYDPLYSWSLSPLKAKKMQEEQAGEKGVDVGYVEEQTSKKEDDAGEASRALSVVERKLSKALSSAAAVSELIQQATDERNLAVLFAGWSAFC